MSDTTSQTTDDKTTSMNDTEGDGEDKSLITKGGEDEGGEDKDKSLITKGDDKDGDKAGDKDEAPEPLKVEDLVLPEGFEADDESQAALVEILNKGLSAKELAGELINLQAKMAQAASESISETWDAMQAEWKQAAEAHPDFGGDKLKPTLGSIKELINEVMGDEAKSVFDAMDLTLAGDNPAMISFLAKVAAERAEGKPATGSPTSLPQSAAEAMFPNQGKQT